MLASSTHAVSNTLVTIKKRLENLRISNVDDTSFLTELIEDDDLETDYLEQLDDTSSENIDKAIDIKLLEIEITELELIFMKFEV